MAMRAVRWLIALAAAAAVVALCVVFGRGLIHLLGIDTQQSDNYDFVSGVGPMLIAALGYIGIIGGMWKHLNCHADGCMLIGRYPVAGGKYKVCRRHHPDDEVRARGLSVHLIHREHAAHQQAQAKL
jgi:hypothetical protein